MALHVKLDRIIGCVVEIKNFNKYKILYKIAEIEERYNNNELDGYVLTPFFHEMYYNLPRNLLVQIVELDPGQPARIGEIDVFVGFAIEQMHDGDDYKSGMPPYISACTLINLNTYIPNVELKEIKRLIKEEKHDILKMDQYLLMTEI